MFKRILSSLPFVAYSFLNWASLLKNAGFDCLFRVDSAYLGEFSKDEKKRGQKKRRRERKKKEGNELTDSLDDDEGHIIHWVHARSERFDLLMNLFEEFLGRQF